VGSAASSGAAGPPIVELVGHMPTKSTTDRRRADPLAFLPEGPGEAHQARSRARGQPMWTAVDRDGEPWGRAGVVEAEQGDDSVNVHEQHRGLSWHLVGAR